MLKATRIPFLLCALASVVWSASGNAMSCRKHLGGTFPKSDPDVIALYSHVNDADKLRQVFSEFYEQLDRLNGQRQRLGEMWYFSDKLELETKIRIVVEAYLVNRGQPYQYIRPDRLALMGTNKTNIGRAIIHLAEYEQFPTWLTFGGGDRMGGSGGKYISDLKSVSLSLSRRLLPYIALQSKRTRLTTGPPMESTISELRLRLALF